MNALKAVVQLLGAVLLAVIPLLPGATAELTATEWINVGLVAAGAVTVYIADNHLVGTIWEYSKMAMSMVSAVGVVLVSVLTDGLVSTNEWFQVAAAILTVLAVYKVPGPGARATVGRHRAPDPEGEPA